MREMSTEITIGEDTYRIRKMDAFSGAGLLKLLMEKFMPLMQRLQDTADKTDDKPVSEEEANAKTMSMLSEVVTPMLESISEDELKSLMVKCLRYADKKLKSGWVTVLDKSHNFAVDGVEYDIILCLQLVLQVIFFNCSGFFGGSGLNLPKLSPNT